MCCMRKVVLYVFHALFIVIPLFFSFKSDELFEFNKMVATYVFTIFIVTSWLIRMIIEKRWIWKKTPFDFPIAIFLLSQFFSTLLSMHPRTSWLGYYSRFNGGLLSLISYAGLYFAFANNVQKKELAGMFRTLLYGGLLVAIYAIPEHFGHSPSCVLVGSSFDTSCWVQDVQTRVFGTFGQPNWLAAYLLMLILYAFGMFLQITNGDKNEKRGFSAISSLLYFILTLMFLATLLFTRSRSGFLGLVVGFGVFAALQLFHAIKYHTLQKTAQHLLPKLAVSAVGFLAVLVLFGQDLLPTLRPVIHLIFPQQTQEESGAKSTTPAAQPTTGTQLESGGTESGTIRKIVWDGAIRVWKRYPVFGSGVETFAYSYYQDRPVEHNLVSEWDFLYNKAHNEFLNFLATTGTMGFASYIMLIGWIYIWGIASISSKPAFPNISAGLLAAFTGLHVSNFFGFSTVVVQILFFLTPAFLLIYSMNEESTEQAIAAKKKNISKQGNLLISPAQWTAIGIVFMLSGFLLFRSYTYWQADALYSRAKQYEKSGYGTEAIALLQRAIELSPNEAVFHDELSSLSAELAVQAATQKQNDLAQQLAQYAVLESDKTLELNNAHLNFYKTRARVFITLSQLEPTLLKEAERTLVFAREKAPTDAKIVFNLAIFAEQEGEKGKAISLYEEAIRLKPNYLQAQEQLEKLRNPESK